MTPQQIKGVGAQFTLNGEYFKNIYGETHIYKRGAWVRYKFIFTHEDMIQCQYL